LAICAISGVTAVGKHSRMSIEAGEQAAAVSIMLIQRPSARVVRWLKLGRVIMAHILSQRPD
jgi:hypothetical protein